MNVQYLHPAFTILLAYINPISPSPIIPISIIVSFSLVFEERIEKVQKKKLDFYVDTIGDLFHRKSGTKPNHQAPIWQVNNALNKSFNKSCNSHTFGRFKGFASQHRLIMSKIS